MKFVISKAISFAAKPAKVEVKAGAKTIQSKSPKATGVAGNFTVGKTRSGHDVHSYSHKQPTNGWSSQDHIDAYHAHAKHMSSISHENTNPELLKHHKDAMLHHWAKSNGSSVKKSRDRIGRTKNGHDIEKHNHASHADHSKWKASDHSDAAHAHNKRAMKIMDSMIYFSHPDRKDKHKKLIAALKNSLKRHTHHARGHHHLAQGGK